MGYLCIYRIYITHTIPTLKGPNTTPSYFRHLSFSHVCLAVGIQSCPADKMLRRSLTASWRSRPFRIASLIISAALSLILYTSFITDRSSIKEISKLGLQFFSRPNEGIPKKIWYKLGPKGQNDDIREWTGSCISQNPDYSFEFMTDTSADAYVEKTFSSTRPDIVEVYLNLTIPILKADLLRYLLLYAEGGIWSDLDVSCEGVPIDEWVPPEYKKNASLVVGWEFDWGWDSSYFHEFASWTIMSKPGLNHMLMVVDDIVESIHTARVEHKVPVQGLTTSMVGDIVDFTGPRRLTRSILKSLEVTLGRTIERQEIENIREPILVDNVLILPGHAFADATNDFSKDGGRPGPVLVTHHYAGSWKNEHGGELARRRRKG